jgi:hypothetical protein
MWINYGTELAAAAAQALIAAGSLDEATANAVFDEYTVAFALRGGVEPEEALWCRRTLRKVDLSAPRTVDGALAVGRESEGLVLHRLFLAEGVTELELSSTSPLSAGPAEGTIRPPKPFQRRRTTPQRQRPQPPAVTVADDQRTAVSLSAFDWSDLDPGWKATFHTNAQLSAVTAWLEIDGGRVELPPPGPPPEVRTEAVPALVNPVEAMLYREALSAPCGSLQDGAAVKALVATGSLLAEDPLLAEVEQVAKAVCKRRAVGGLPEPWASLLRRVGKHDGPVGSLSIGAAVNSGEGWSVRFDSLTSNERDFQVAVAVSPAAVLRSPADNNARLEQLCTSPVAIEWRAEDDIGNSYLAVGERHRHWEGGVVGGELSFLSPIAPEAQVLNLIAMGQRERAVVAIPLRGLGHSR